MFGFYDSSSDEDMYYSSDDDMIADYLGTGYFPTNSRLDPLNYNSDDSEDSFGDSYNQEFTDVPTSPPPVPEEMIILTKEPLSDDIMLSIFKFCDGVTIGRLTRCCKKFKEQLDVEDRWKQLYEQEFMRRPKPDVDYHYIYRSVPSVIDKNQISKLLSYKRVFIMRSMHKTSRCGFCYTKNITSDIMYSNNFYHCARCRDEKMLTKSNKYNIKLLTSM